MIMAISLRRIGSWRNRRSMSLLRRLSCTRRATFSSRELTLIPARSAPGTLTSKRNRLFSRTNSMPPPSPCEIVVVAHRQHRQVAHRGQQSRFTSPSARPRNSR